MLNKLQELFNKDLQKGAYNLSDVDLFIKILNELSNELSKKGQKSIPNTREEKDS